MTSPSPRAHHEDSDDEVPQLSAHALAALQEFYAERLQTASKDEDDPTITGDKERVDVAEDWQLSQFWYSEGTSQVLADEALDASQSKRIACVSCPTLYTKLISMKPQSCQTVLLEYDRRFEIYGENFIYYDYNHLPGERLREHSFDLVVADPPYLSEECLRKTSQTVKHLAKDKILLCTGAVMEELAYELLGLKKCVFVPTHARNLANEFRCFANYDSRLNRLVEGNVKTNPPVSA